MNLDRRRFLARSGAWLAAASAGFVTGAIPFAAAGPGFGLLRQDPAGVLDLPAGFSYTIVSVAGRKMTDGFIAPSLSDGAAAFPGPNGLTLLVRNHEFRVGHPDELGPFGGRKKLWKSLDRAS